MMDEQEAMEKRLVLFVWNCSETKGREKKGEEEQEENRGEAEEQWQLWGWGGEEASLL